MVGAKFWPYYLCTPAEIEMHHTRPCFSSLQMFSFDEPLLTAASALCSWQTIVEPDVIVCCCSPSTSRFDMLWIVRCLSAQHYCTDCVTVAFLSAWISLAILHWPPSSIRHFRLQNCHSLDVFFFFATFWVNTRYCCSWKSQEENTNLSHTNNHVMVNVTEITFSPVLMVHVNVTRYCWPVSIWFYVLHCWHKTGWLNNCMNA